MNIELVRVYDVTTATQGYRVLVDRIWPRGISKDTLSLDEWCKDLAPSAGLRKWFGHDPARWTEFRSRYLEEMRSKADTLDRLRRIASERKLVLLYSARDHEHNQAVVIRDAMTGEN